MPTALASRELSSMTVPSNTSPNSRRTWSTASVEVPWEWPTKGGQTWTTISAWLSTSRLASRRPLTTALSATKPLISLPSIPCKRSCLGELSISLESFLSLERLSQSILRAVVARCEDTFRLLMSQEHPSQLPFGAMSCAKETILLREKFSLSRVEKLVSSVAEASTAPATAPLFTLRKTSRRRRDSQSCNSGVNNLLSKAWETWSRHSLEPSPSPKSLNPETSKEWEKWRKERSKAISM